MHYGSEVRMEGRQCHRNTLEELDDSRGCVKPTCYWSPSSVRLKQNFFFAILKGILSLSLFFKKRVH